MTLQARIPEVKTPDQSHSSGVETGSFCPVTIVLPEEAADGTGQVLVDLLHAANDLIPEANFGVTVLRLSDLNQLRHGRQNRSLCIFLGDLRLRWRVTPAERSVLQTLLHHCRQPIVVGGAAFLLHEAGMFAGHRLAVHPNFIAAAAEENLETAPTGTQFLATGAVFSAVSPLATLRLLLQIVARQHGEFMAGALAEYVGLDVGDTRFQSKASVDILQRAGGDTLIAKSLHLMQQHIEEPISICELARQQGVSTRKLQRRFRDRTGNGPQTAYRNLRIERAQQLLIHTSMNVYEIVAATGFGTRSNLSRWFHKQLGVSPQAVRRKAYCEATTRQAMAS